MKSIIFILMSLLSSDLAFAQYQTGDSWVTDYLSKGGSLSQITGLKNQAPDARKFRRVKTVRDLPSHFDWREQVGDLQPIRNQGSCGSCWAFAGVAVVESAMVIQSFGTSINLAEQTPVSSCSNSGSCQGGYFTVFDYIRDQGLPWEGDDPYQARNTKCKSGLKRAMAMPGSKGSIYDWFYIGQSNQRPSVDEIKAAIYRYGPVAVDVNGNFGGYRSGIYDNCGSTFTNHMVTLEGWDDDGEYWIMRNSWGENWGENGRMRIKWKDSRGRNCNGVGNVAAAVLIFPDSIDQIAGNNWLGM